MRICQIGVFLSSAAFSDVPFWDIRDVSDVPRGRVPRNVPLTHLHRSGKCVGLGVKCEGLGLGIRRGVVFFFVGRLPASGNRKMNVMNVFSELASRQWSCCRSTRRQPGTRPRITCSGSQGQCQGFGHFFTTVGQEETN